MLEFSINTSQLVAGIWTMIAIILSVIVAVNFFPYQYYSIFMIPYWALTVLIFFASLLVMTLPVYLLLALWHALSRRSETE